MSDLFTDPAGDVFFSASDRDATTHVFRVSSAVLSRHSEMFGGMFEITPPSSPSDIAIVTNPLPTPAPGVEGTQNTPISIDCTSVVFDTILRILYRDRSALSPPSADPELLAECLHFADKYIISSALDTLQALITHPRILAKDPFRAYFLACHYGAQDVEMLMRHTLTKDLGSLERIKELDAPHAGLEYHALVKLHGDTRRKTIELLRKFSQCESIRYPPWWNSTRCLCNPLASTTPASGEAIDWNPPLWARLFTSTASAHLGTSFSRESAREIFQFGFIIRVVRGTGCKGCFDNMSVPKHAWMMDDLRREVESLFDISG